MANLTLQSAQDLIGGALRRINSYAPGQKPEGIDVQDALQTLNDLLDAWSIDTLMVYGSNENILTWTPLKGQYTIGNPIVGTFTGTLVAGSNVISGVTIPAGLVLGGTLTDVLSSVPTGALVTAIGANTVTFGPGTAISTQATPETFQFTVPGDFALARPLRITAAFTRVGGFDYSMRVCSQEQWTPLVYKAQPAPWPILLYYNNAHPYGIINVYQAPSQAGELHLWTDTILSQMTINQTVNLPQGYSRMIKWNLAEELWPEYYDDPVPAAIMKNAKTSRAAIEALNAVPMPVATYDSAIVRPSQTDAGWILHGGF